MAIPKSCPQAFICSERSKHTSDNAIKKPRPQLRYVGEAKAALIADAVLRGDLFSSDSMAIPKEPPAIESVVNHHELQTHERILSAIEHQECEDVTTKQQVVYNYVTVAMTDPPSRSLELLRESNLPTLIRETRGSETYALPVPIKQAFGALPCPWWVGLSPAQIRAGPIADEADVKKAASELNAKAIRQKKSLQSRNGLLRTQAEYMLESLRRQVLRLPMQGSVSRGEERRAMDKYGCEWEMVLQELDEENDTISEDEATDSNDDENLWQNVVELEDSDDDEYRDFE